MSSTVTLIGYIVLVVLGVLLWLFSILRPNLVTPLGKLVDRLTSRRRTRIALVAIWWWLGWHFYTNLGLAILA